LASVTPPKQLSLRELAETYLRGSSDGPKPRLKPGSVDTYRKSLRAAKGLTVDGRRVLDQDAKACTPPWAQRVHDAQASIRGGATADKLIKLFSAATSWGHKRGLVSDQNPWTTVDRYGCPPPRVAFPRGWLRQQLEALDAARTLGIVPPRAADLWTICHTTGARPRCEVATLRWCDVDVAGAIIFGQTKGEGTRSRAIPLELLGELGHAALERQRGRSATWVWPGTHAQIIGESTIMKHWPRFIAFAAERGVMTVNLDGRPLTLYVASRHGAASYWADELGVPRDVVARLLGHAPGSKSVDRYTHLSVASLVEPAQRIAASLSTPEAPMITPERLGIDRGRLYRLATSLPHVCKTDGTPYTERAIKSWKREKLPPHEVLHSLALQAGVSPAWLYGEGDETLPPTGGS
jgi:integrase